MSIWQRQRNRAMFLLEMLSSLPTGGQVNSANNSSSKFFHSIFIFVIGIPVTKCQLTQDNVSPKIKWAHKIFGI